MIAYLPDCCSPVLTYLELAGTPFPGLKITINHLNWDTCINITNNHSLLTNIISLHISFLTHTSYIYIYRAEKQIICFLGVFTQTNLGDTQLFFKQEVPKSKGIIEYPIKLVKIIKYPMSLTLNGKKPIPQKSLSVF